ncbi:HNH endonuclease [Actinoplanes sp. NBRC 14428]|nr:HNH endonuclease [Actinoplanes sp. NBRC 14428]
MWEVSPPATSALAAFRTCIRTIEDLDLRQRLRNAENSIVDADKKFIAAVHAGDVSSLDPKALGMPDVSTKEMEWVYKNRMVKSTGRSIYEKLKLAAKEDRCPLCGHRDVSTLDHYLPKTVIPALAVNPYNLVPACSECNKIKRAIMPRVAEDATMNPYFDSFDDELWLVSDVLRTVPASFRFRVSRPASWDDVTSARAMKHFEVFDLAQLYSTQAARELVNIRYSLNIVSGVGGERAVQDHLAREAASRIAAHLNSWESAMYSAMSVQDWFCRGGYASP